MGTGLQETLNIQSRMMRAGRKNYIIERGNRAQLMIFLSAAIFLFIFIGIILFLFIASFVSEFFYIFLLTLHIYFLCIFIFFIYCSLKKVYRAIFFFLYE